MFEWQIKNGVKFLKLTEFERDGVKALFTSRIGGVSKGAYESLNMAFHTADKFDNVKENRRIICDILDINPEFLTAGEQVHGNKVQIVQQKDKGKGAINRNSIKNIDGLITNESIPLIAFFADCVPLFFVDPDNKVIAIAHAGWKGTVLKIGKIVLQKMIKNCGTNIQSCRVGIGPAISGTNYEVDNNVVRKFKNNFNNCDKFIEKKANGKYNLSLKSANKILIQEMGVPSARIAVSKLCTYDSQNDFYSYRRDNGKTGRMAALIYFKK